MLLHAENYLQEEGGVVEGMVICTFEEEGILLFYGHQYGNLYAFFLTNG